MGQGATATQTHHYPGATATHNELGLHGHSRLTHPTIGMRLARNASGGSRSHDRLEAYPTTQDAENVSAQRDKSGPFKSFVGSPRMEGFGGSLRCPKKAVRTHRHRGENCLFATHIEKGPAAPSAHRRPRYSSASCSSAELASASPCILKRTKRSSDIVAMP